MFEVTQEEINEALGSGKVTFKDKEEVHFSFVDVEEVESKKGSDKEYIVKTIILSGDNKGKKYTFWLDRNVEMKKKVLTRMVLSVNKASDILGVKAPLATFLIGKSAKSTCTQRGSYFNFDYWSLSDMKPESGGLPAQPDLSDIPF